MLKMKKNVLKRDKYDELMYRENLSTSERIIKFIESNKEYKPIDELLKDTFNAFYKYMPKFENVKQIEPLYRPNHTVISKLMKMQKYNELRSVTKLDPLNSAVATITFLEAIQEIIEEFKKEQKNLENLQNQLQNASDEQEKQQIQQQINQILKNLQNKVTTKVINTALEQVVQDVSDMEEAMAGFLWGSEPGTYQQVSPEERMKIAKLLLENRNLLKLAKMIGRYKNLAVSTYKSKIRRIPSEVYETSLGDELVRLLPHEYMKLIDPDLEVLFYKDLVEKKLQHYKLSDKTEREKGDFVVCIDLSGSMSGEKEMWAKAVALATLEIAVREKRGWVIIPFDSEVYENFIKQFDKKHKPSIEDILDIASMDFGGGTDFEKPLAKAMEFIREKEHGDVLFITDGIAEISESFCRDLLEWKQKTGCRIVSVSLEVTPTDTLKKISDKIFEIREFTDIAAKEIFSVY